MLQAESIAKDADRVKLRCEGRVAMVKGRELEPGKRLDGSRIRNRPEV